MKQRPYSIIEIKRKAVEIRLSILDEVADVGSGHIFGAYSCNDVLVVLYYARFMKVNPNKPLWLERYRFCLILIFF